MDASAADRVTAAGAITEVVVYPDRARITRERQVPCEREAVATFSALPAAAEPASFRAFSRAGAVLGLRWESRPRVAAFTDRVQTIDRRLRETREALRAAEQQLQRLDGAAAARAQYFATAERLVGEQLLRGRPNLGAWSAALDTVVQVELEAERARAALVTRLRTLKAGERALEQERTALGGGGAHAEHVVEVTVSCPSRDTATVALTYLVGGAGWNAAYEARTGRGDGGVELVTQATVRQTTGEDWQAARLVLSTALPREDATLPALRPLVIQARERDADDRSIVTRQEEVAHTPGAAALPVASTGTGVRAAEQGLSVQMTLPRPPLVPGDGREVLVSIGRTRQTATLHLWVVPALSAHVYRVAELVNNTPFPLLPGTIDIYEAGAFVGRDRLEETPVRGKLAVTLGIEEKIQARRQIVQDRLRRRGLFGRAHRQEVGYRYALVSRLTAPVQVELADHVPVSELEDVRVILAPGTSGGHRLNPRDGLIRWALRLEPGVERRVDLGFQIDLPAGYRP